VRSGGIVLEGLGFLMTLALALLAAFGVFAHELLWVGAAVVTLVGALPVVSSMVGSRSPGALDNASGVAAVMSAARQLGDQVGVGVLITDAEELGLAGARAWANGREATTVLNCDGVDDHGAIYLMFTGDRPDGLVEAATRASASSGVAHHARRMALGVLADSVAFTDAGMSAATFSRGSMRSFGRVHSRRDDLAHLRGDGIEPTAALMAATARELDDVR
jgi:Zn-dependent M28 family amino/carboxypeptidase